VANKRSNDPPLGRPASFLGRNWLIAAVALVLGVTLYLANRKKTASNSPEHLVIVGARIIDCTGRPPIEQGVLVIEKGKIVSVSASKHFEPPVGARIVDAEGRTVLPSLIDTSVHFFIGSAGPAQTTEEFMPERILADMRAMVYWGVLTVRDSGDSTVFATRFRDNGGGSDRIAPDLYLSVPWITAVGGYPANFLPAPVASDATKQISSAVEIPAVIDSLRGSGVNVTEVSYDGGTQFRPYPRLSLALLQSFVTEAHGKGLRVCALTRSNQEIEQAVESGVDYIEHLSGEVLDGAAIKALGDHGTYYCPLLTQHQAEAASTGEIDKTLNNPEVQQTVSAVIRNGLAAHRGFFFDLKSDSWANSYFKEALANSLRNLALASQAGVKITLASGAGSPAVFYGLSTHQELAMMVATGLTPMQALMSATKNAAELIGVADRVGTVEPGKLANLLIVDGDPLENIAATKNISIVIKDGKIVERSDLIVQ
jgi:imidazolonepropionase-like amidohydrolase